MWTSFATAAAAAKSLQSYPTLCYPIDGSPPDSPIPGILQARTLEWVAISFSNAWQWKVKGKSLSRVWLLATPWTAAHQAPPSMGFSRQEYWSGVPSPSPHLPLLPTLFHVPAIPGCGEHPTPIWFRAFSQYLCFILQDVYKIFIWLLQILIVAHGIFNLYCSMWHL